MEKLKFQVPSSDEIHTLQGVIYLPEGEAKGYFHIVHGMVEHIGRYDRLMCELAQQGYICFGYDNLGHGNTAKGDFGYIADKNGHDLLAQDVKRFADAVMAQFGKQELPYYLMGHSMGSFITRYAVQKHVKPTKYIIMGTGGKNAAAGIGLALLACIERVKGGRHISSLAYKLAFGAYNKRFGGGTKEDPSPWLTCDQTEREKYYADPFCSFQFTVSAMRDLIRLNKLTNSRAWYHDMPKDLPILLLSGENDPVGDYGKGVRQVHTLLQKEGIDASCILYPNARHEILNDSTYAQVKQDILTFLE